MWSYTANRCCQITWVIAVLLVRTVFSVMTPHLYRWSSPPFCFTAFTLLISRGGTEEQQKPTILLHGRSPWKQAWTFVCESCLEGAAHKLIYILSISVFFPVCLLTKCRSSPLYGDSDSAWHWHCFSHSFEIPSWCCCCFSYSYEFAFWPTLLC